MLWVFAWLDFDLLLSVLMTSSTLEEFPTSRRVWLLCRTSQAVWKICFSTLQTWCGVSLRHTKMTPTGLMKSSRSSMSSTVVPWVYIMFSSISLKKPNIIFSLYISPVINRTYNYFIWKLQVKSRIVIDVWSKMLVHLKCSLSSQV